MIRMCGPVFATGSGTLDGCHGVSQREHGDEGFILILFNERPRCGTGL
jgi:hypothetical protein